MTVSISREDLKILIDQGTATVVDALPESYYTQQHLPGAVNLVEADVAARAESLLPDKAALIVTYCANTACPNSEQVATGLEALGYTNVRKYAAGIQDWAGHGYPVEAGLPASR